MGSQHKNCILQSPLNVKPSDYVLANRNKAEESRGNFRVFFFQALRSIFHVLPPLAANTLEDTILTSKDENHLRDG